MIRALQEAISDARSARRRYYHAQDQALPELLDERDRHESRKAEIESQYKADIKGEHRLTEFWHRTNAWVRRTIAMNAEDKRNETNRNRILDRHSIPECEERMARSRMRAHNVLDEMIGESEGEAP